MDADCIAGLSFVQRNVSAKISGGLLRRREGRIGLTFVRLSHSTSLVLMISSSLAAAYAASEESTRARTEEVRMAGILVLSNVYRSYSAPWLAWRAVREG